MKRSALPVIILLLAVTAVHAQAIPSLALPSVRVMALGGLHAAEAHGLDAIFENPAGFAQDGQSLSLGAVTAGLTGPVFDIAGIAMDLMSGSGSMDLGSVVNLLDASGRLFVQADVRGPLQFGYVGKGLGFGLFNRTVAIVNVASLLSADVYIGEELLLCGGYSQRISLGGGHSLDIGIMPKGFMQAGLVLDGTIEDILALQDANAEEAAALPFRIVTGLGFDAGVRWSWNDVVAIGIVAHDPYSPAQITSYTSLDAFLEDPGAARDGDPAYTVVEADLSAGLLWNLPFQFLTDLGARVSLMIDYRDILDLLAIVPRNPILNLGMGIEASFLEILSVRAGLNEGLLSAGFGVDLSFFTFSLAMYGSELGLEPGLRPAYNLAVSLDFVY